MDVTERKQAEEQIKGFNAELEAINRVLQEGLSSATQEELRRACLTIAEEATGSEFGLLGELNVDGRFEAVLVSDRARRPCGIAGGCRAEGAAFEAFGRLLGRFVSEDKGTYTNAPQTHPDQLDLPPGYPPLKAFLAIPLIHGETTIGVIGLGNRPGGYGVRDLRTAEALTPVIVQVLLRKRDQEAFREGEERFRALAEMVPSFLWMAQPDGSITHVNPRFEAYAGIPVASMLDNGWLEALHPEDADRAYQVWAEPIRTKSLYSIEYRIRRFDGRYRWFASRGLPMRNPSGEVTAWIGSITDVNDLKASEARLQRANKELRQFAYAAAHDLQEPLRNISTSISMLSLLHGQQMDAAATEWLNAGEAGAKRMHAMVQGLLSYMKSVEYTGPVNQVTASGEALDTAIANIELAIQESRAKVIADALPSVGIPSPQMIQLFQNLIGNAVKYRKPEENPVIRVSARDDGIEVEFAISDNGIGFEPKYAEGIFGIFKRLHTQTEYSGSGMGLAICARIVSFYGGRIWAEGRPGKGATFHFTAPSG